MRKGPRRKHDERSEFVREVLRPLLHFEKTLRGKRSNAINKHARFVDGVIQKCPTYGQRLRPKIIFDTEEAAALTQKEFAKVGFDESYPYPCTYGGERHWHLGRTRTRPE